jgi:hypothetical protein
MLLPMQKDKDVPIPAQQAVRVLNPFLLKLIPD